MRKTSGNIVATNRSALFDWSVFITSILLGFVFPTLGDLVHYRGFSWLMLSALLLYGIGAWLKHLSFYYRLYMKGRTTRDIPYLIFLVIGHWVVMLMVILFAESAARSMLRIQQDEKNIASGWTVFACIALASFFTWIVFHHRRKVRNPEKLSQDFIFYREIVADIFLYVSISVFSFVFWEKGILSLLGRPPETVAQIVFIFLLLGFAYLLFYLPLRYLYFIEDYSSKQTWRRLLLIFGLILVRSLFTALNL